MKKFLLLLAIVIFTFSNAYAALEVGSWCKVDATIKYGRLAFRDILHIVEFKAFVIEAYYTDEDPNKRNAVAKLRSYIKQLDDEGKISAVSTNTKVEILEVFTPSIKPSIFDSPVTIKSKSYVKVKADEYDEAFWVFDVYLNCE